MEDKEIMKMGVDRARRTMRANIGGPFGAVITKGDEIIAVSSNSVLQDHDPTCHAEINAIRQACKVLGTHDLSECTIYCTSQPCPMCLSAIIWANIKKAYYGCTAIDAAAIGFRDDYIYNFIKQNCKDAQVLELLPIDKSDCIELFNEYHATAKEMY